VRPAPARAAALAPLALVALGAAFAGAGIVAPGLALAAAGGVIGVANWYLGAPGRLAARLGAIPADPLRHARLRNVVEGLCVVLGLPVPALRVLEDASRNAIVLGPSARRAVLVCTTGLLESVDRMALEGLVAHELAHVKSGDVARAAAATISCGVLAAVLPSAGRVVARLAGPAREALADLDAVRVTRYPPGLIAALEAVSSAGSARPRLSPSLARLTGALWFSPLAESFGPRPRPGTLDVDLRLAALREL